MELAKQTIKTYDLCPKHATITVGVSGGADSIALLHLLWKLSAENDWHLQVVHVNHGLRGAEADRDEKFVETLCKEWGIPCFVFNFDVVGEAKKRGLGEEEMGRQMRYESFAKVAGNGIIAVAHNQNDQGETILMRLSRGTGLKGLCGMRPKRGNVVRPLLYCSRVEIEAYCAKEGLAFCTDSTNEKNIYTRNQIRNEILPQLEEIYPKATLHMAECSQRLAAEEDFLQSLAEERLADCLLSQGGNQIALNRVKLTNQPTVLVRRMISAVLAKLGQTKDLSAMHLDAVMGLLQQETGKSVDLPKGIVVCTEYDSLVFSHNIPKERGGFSYELIPNGTVFVPEGDFFVEMAVFLEKIEENAEDTYTKIFDYDTINNTLFCRTRWAGDCLKFSYGTKKLKDFFIDTKTPKTKREQTPLIVFDQEVIWMVGGCVLEAYLPKENTKRFLRIHIRRNSNERTS